MSKSTLNLFPQLLENNEAKRRIAVDILNGTLFHSIMLVGADGVGKSFFAYQIAAALNCEKKNDDGMPLPCGECASCKKILGGHSLDVMIFDREEHGSFGVDKVRELREDAVVTSNELDSKVYILDDFHYMTHQAQNAALKILEEPPKNVYFILLCKDIQNVLETVISRVIRFDLRPLSEDSVRCFLDANYGGETGKSVEKTNEIVKFSRGYLGCAIDAVTADSERYGELIDEYRMPEKVLSLLTKRSEKLQIIDIINGLSKDRQSLAAFFSDVECAARDIIAYKSSHDASREYYITEDSVMEASMSLPLRKVYMIAELSLETREQCLRNTNIQLLKDKYASGLIKIINS